VTLPALVLAAGRGRRFEEAGGAGPKVLAPVDGRPVLRHAIGAAEVAGLAPIVVVVSPDLADVPAFETVRDAHPNVTVVVNRRASEGMGTSLAAGLEHLALDPSAAACVVLLGDQPGIAPTVIADAVATWRRNGAPVRARYLDGPGHPVVLPAATWSMLMGRTADGARDVLEGLTIEEVVVGTPAPRDIDVPDDLTS
jgi:molybdenum cofactor cytidylyltransferase